MSNQPTSENGGAALIQTICKVMIVIIIIVQVKACVRTSVRWTVEQTHKVERHVKNWTHEMRGLLPQSNQSESGPSTTPRTWRIFDIPKEGLYIHLESVWQDHALGGNITITTPDGVVLYDEPGAEHNYGKQRGGTYVFRANPPGEKRQVQIENSW